MPAQRARDRFAATIAWNASAIATGSARAWTVTQSLVLPPPETVPSLGRIGDLDVRLVAGRKDLRRAQRLRYKVFYEERDLVPDRISAFQRRDICPFDQVCDHLIVTDHAYVGRRSGIVKPKVVGTYRLLRQQMAEQGSGFYTAREFDIAPVLARHTGKVFLELGRSCVLPDYRSKRTIELLWRGIWSYVRQHGIDVLFGCASFEGTDPTALAPGLSFLHHYARAEPAWQARPSHAEADAIRLLPAEAIDRRTALAALPPLIKGYLRAGARFGDGVAIDRRFRTTDVLAILPLADLDRRYLAHFGSA